MALFKWIGMGDLRKPATNEPWSSGSEKYFGLENALYFCKPFRECVVNFPNGPNDANGTGENKANEETSTSNGLSEDTLFGALKDLFWKISSQKKRTGVMAPNGFISKLKKENELFRSTMHQDAHEFLNYILNAVAENSKSSVNGASINESEESGISADGSSSGSSENTSNTFSSKTTWVHQLFEGTLTNETKCLTCETITSRDDPFLDLSIDIEQNSSVTSCLRQFSASEMLVHQNKFFCDVCCGLQEAEKSMKIKKLPNVLALHLKRFKYQEKLQKYIKLSYRVVFPFELRLFNTCDDIKDPDRLYELYAICVHIGSGPYHGHYVTLVKSMGQWLLFDDENVETVDESEIHKYFGDLPATGSGYVLFYQACDLDLSSLGLPYSVWANNVASSSSSDFEISAEGAAAAESHPIDIQLTPNTTNGVNDNGNNNTSANNEELKREHRQTPVREPSFSERWILRKNNNSDKRKSHVDQDSKDNDENTHEKTPSHEKEKSSWFGNFIKPGIFI
ncbi:12189_t:CDS:10 [Funneliformis mosseae]|uniref:ubiquitinyl hydrolase 1 n=1 Tax=Funneliformis mosseae TaxID=27381 RepID=A0A9N9ABH8_FUNMO|nr:12189_t:CDS:10 [Funneliformis mosseae]